MSDQTAFEEAIQLLQTEAANVGAQLAWDGATRKAYARNIQAMSTDIRLQVQAGNISWAKAAEQAHQMRDVIMQTIRGRSSPIGRAMAEAMKRIGPTFNAMVARKAIQLFGKDADFGLLNSAQKDRIFAAIVESAGEANPRVMEQMRVASRAGRALLVFSIAMSVYNIATSNDKVNATKKEIVITGAGIAGGALGGAAAGLMCGPGAPACVVVGAFVGGAMAAMGVEWAW